MRLIQKLQELKNNSTNSDFIPFFRISIGLILLMHFLSILGDFKLLYGLNSIIPSDIHTLYVSEYIILFDEIISLINNLTSSELVSIFVFKIIYIVLCVLIILGFYSRFFSILLLILQVSLIKSSYYYSYGVDFFSSMSLLYIMLLPSDDYFSLKQYLFKLKRKSNYNFVLKTFQIHLSIAYFVSGLEKLSGYNWRNGESVWKALHLPNFSNDFSLDFNYLGKFPEVILLIGWLTILIELLYPIFINLKKTRLIWLYLTILLHLGIALTLNLYFFSAIMITWNITNFYFIKTDN